jgi:hypothetical protein
MLAMAQVDYIRELFFNEGIRYSGLCQLVSGHF